MSNLSKLTQRLSKKSVAKLRMRVLRPYLIRQYTDYCSKNFVMGLEAIGIQPGDSLFLMCSQDRIYLKTGKIIPVPALINDLIQYLGEEGTLMTLCFPVNRDKILKKTKVFNVKKSATESGMLAEVLRRKKGSVRSLHPIFSAVSYGKKAHQFSSKHHQSPYPFGPMSPYYQVMADGGKYLGIGVGFEAFTPCHMIEDHFQDVFKHKIYYDQPEQFAVILPDGREQIVSTYIRNPSTFPKGGYDPIYYFKSLKISNAQTETQSGIKLFTFKIQDFFDTAVHIYKAKQITVWDTGSLTFSISKKVKQFLRPFLRT